MITPIFDDIDKSDIVDFFNCKADVWDQEFTGEGPACTKIVNYDAIKKSLKNANVLNVGCGTGAFTQALIESNSKKIKGIDISPKMINIAKHKFTNKICDFEVQDILEIDEENLYDVVVMYNVYPHIPNKQKLLMKVYDILNSDGRFIIAHGASRKIINSHHKIHAKKISTKLEPAKSAALFWGSKFDIDLIIDGSIYIVSGTKLN